MEGGPFVQFAVICRRHGPSVPGGPISIHDITAYFEPDMTRGRKELLWLYVGLAGGIPGTPAALTIRVEAPGGRVNATAWNGTPEFGPDGRAFWDQDFYISKEWPGGTYWFEVWVSRRMLTRVPLTIHRTAAPSPAQG